MLNVIISSVITEANVRLLTPKQGFIINLSKNNTIISYLGFENPSNETVRVNIYLDSITRNNEIINQSNYQLNPYIKFSLLNHSLELEPNEEGRAYYSITILQPGDYVINLVSSFYSGKVSQSLGSEIKIRAFKDEEQNLSKTKLITTLIILVGMIIFITLLVLLLSKRKTRAKG